MAETLEALQQRYLKEQLEYQDAVAAYEQTLNRVASSMPIPAATQSNYSVASGGYKRSATDPWMVQNHPELTPLAKRLEKEEAEYHKAVDDHSAYFANNKCSIAGYVGDKFYEYVALAEMVYKLATDSAFREQILSQVEESAKNGLLHDVVTMFDLTDRYTEAMVATGPEASRKTQEKIDESIAAGNRVFGRLQSYFANKWAEFKKGWEECGLAHAVTKAGIDGVFFLGELAIGGVLIKGVKLSYQLTKAGLHRVEVMSVGNVKSLGSFEWKTEALEAKYGHANDNQVAGLLEDRNRSIPDKPAEDMESGKKREKDKAKIGALAEAQAMDKLKQQGFDDVRILKNNSEHGIDIVGRNSSTGAVKVVEVKANGAGLNNLQSKGGKYYAGEQISRANSGKGHWKSTPEGMPGVARELQKWLRSASSQKYEIWKYDVDDVSESAVFRGSTNWDWEPGKKPKRLVYRDDANDTQGSSENGTPPSTGPP